MAKKERNGVSATGELSGQAVIRRGGRNIEVAVRDGVIIEPKRTGMRTSSSVRQRTVKGRRISEVKVSDGASNPYRWDAVARRVVEVLGSNTVASLVDVSADRPGAWSKGAEQPDAENRQQLADLDALVSQLLSTFSPAQATPWLNGDNAQLGARPVDVYRVHGSGPVIDAMRAHAQGAFA